MVYDARNKILGRLASKVAKDMISARKSGVQQRVIVINAEEAKIQGIELELLAQLSDSWAMTMTYGLMDG